jgi:hypothetical protein
MFECELRAFGGDPDQRGLDPILSSRVNLEHGAEPCHRRVVRTLGVGCAVAAMVIEVSEELKALGYCGDGAG